MNPSGEDPNRVTEWVMLTFGNYILHEIRREQEMEAQSEQVPRPIHHRTFVRRDHAERSVRPHHTDVGGAQRILPVEAQCNRQTRYIPAYEVQGCASSVVLRNHDGHVRRVYSRRGCLENFCDDIVEAFGNTFWQKPNAEDFQFLMNMHERVYDFPRTLGIVDCMHWECKNCPSAWRGQFTSGYKGSHPTMILEAIIDCRLWIWHAWPGQTATQRA